MTRKPGLIIALRGHIRSSMDNNSLLTLLSYLSAVFETRIYVHTWGVVQNSLSWRNISEIPKTVDAGMVFDYLSGLDVRSVAVDDDSSISHVGKVDGTIGRTRCPVLGWKNMYWGKIQLMKAIADVEPPESATLQMRLDILSNPFSPTTKEIVEFVERERNVLANGAGDERIRFLRMHCFMGVDNIYMAGAGDMLRFTSYMYYDMDRILHVHRGTIHQEHIAFHERKSWWNWKLPGESVEGDSSEESS